MSETTSNAEAQSTTDLHQVSWWRTDIGDREIAAIENAIRGRHINSGPLSRQLEHALAEQLEVPHVVLTTSGSVALVLAMIAAGIGPGDEVIIPAVPFIAPAHAARLLGAKVVLADVLSERRPTIDPDRIEEAITERSKAIVVIHPNGKACDLDRINEIARKSGVVVIEDTAQAFRSRGHKGWLGTASDFGTFSLGITKLITTGEGGFVVVHDEEKAEKLRRVRNHGTIAIVDNVFPSLGCNFRMTDLQAAMGLAQIKALQEKIDGVSRVYEFYAQRLSDIPSIEMLDLRIEEGELPLWMEVLCDERDRVVIEMEGRGIQTKPFHPSLVESPHLQVDGDFPNAARLAARGLTLPSGADQSEADLQRTVDTLREVIGGDARA